MEPEFAFLGAVLVQHVCPGRVVRTLDDLEALRTCGVINGSLTIVLNDTNADYTSLFDIETIQGLNYLNPVDCLHDSTSGSLSIVGSSMTSLTTSFANLEIIGASGATTMVDGKPYSLVITGSCA